MIYFILPLVFASLCLQAQSETDFSEDYAYIISVLDPVASSSSIELPPKVNLYVRGINYCKTSDSDQQLTNSSSYSVESLNGETATFDSDRKRISTSIGALKSDFLPEGKTSIFDNLGPFLFLDHNPLLTRSKSWMKITADDFHALPEGYSISATSSTGKDLYLSDQLFHNIQYKTTSESGSSSGQRIHFRLSGDIFQRAKVHFHYSVLTATGGVYTVSDNKTHTVTLTKKFSRRRSRGLVFELAFAHNFVLNSVSSTLPAPSEAEEVLENNLSRRNANRNEASF